MAEKILYTRIIQKHDTTERWNKTNNFIPKEGEIIIYDDVPEKIKIGDGKTSVLKLPFVLDFAINEALKKAEESGAFKGDIGPQGPAGKDGYTPQKGIDYFTDQEILNISKEAAAKIDKKSLGLDKIDNTPDAEKNVKSAEKVPWGGIIEMPEYLIFDCGDSTDRTK